VTAVTFAIGSPGNILAVRGVAKGER